MGMTHYVTSLHETLDEVTREMAETSVQTEFVAYMDDAYAIIPTSHIGQLVQTYEAAAAIRGGLLNRSKLEIWGANPMETAEEYRQYITPVMKMLGNTVERFGGELVMPTLGAGT